MSCCCCRCNSNDDDNFYRATTQDDVVQFLADLHGDDWPEILSEAARLKEQAARADQAWRNRVDSPRTAPAESEVDRDKRLKKEGVDRMERVRVLLGIPAPELETKT